MLKKFLGASFVVSMATLAMAQTTNLVANTTATTTGADGGASFRQTHFTFDLQGSTGTNDWTGSEISVDVVGNGSLWHASNQRVATNNPPFPADPNNPPVCYLHNLNVPALNNNATNRANTLMYDTFFTSPGSAFNVDPTFASPGVPAPDGASCPAQPPIVSTATRIRGTNPSGAEIPLSWFDTVNSPLNNTVLARFTFTVPVGSQGLIVQATSAPAPAGTQPLARLFGRSTTNVNSVGNNFDFTIYQVPEPSTVALLALGGLAGLIRRR